MLAQRDPVLLGKEVRVTIQIQNPCIVLKEPLSTFYFKDNGDETMGHFVNIFKIVLCTLLLASLVSCAGSNTRQSTGQFVDDSTITAKVKAAIFDEDSLKSLQITVVTFKGTVQLSGFVDSTKSVNKAGQVARNVDGVESVKNDLVVK